MKFLIYYHTDQLKWVKSEFIPKLEALSIDYHTDYKNFNPNLPRDINLRKSLEICDTLVLVLDFNFINSVYKEFDKIVDEFGDKFRTRESVICIRKDKTKLPRKLYKHLQFEFYYPGHEAREFENLNTYLRKQLKTEPALFSSESLYASYYQQVYDEYFTGREKELRILSDWIGGSNTHLISIVGSEGCGKTSLLQKVTKIIREKYAGRFDRVFFWSFAGKAHYQDSQYLIEEFFKEAFKWFEYKGAIPKNMYAQGIELAKLVNQQKTLLIIDSIEVGQYVNGRFEGTFSDRGFYGLLRYLSRENRGLCLITSQLEIKDLSQFNKEYIRSLVLNDLKTENAAELLRYQGIKGDEVVLYEVLKNFGTNPLLLKILAQYLIQFCQSDISKTYHLPQLENDDDTSHYLRVLKPFDQALAGTAELNVLRILCLFDYQADLEAINQFKKKPVIVGFNEYLVEDKSVNFPEILDNIVKYNLAFFDEKGHCFIRNSVRKYVVEYILAGMHKELKQAHHRLYNYYKNKCTEEQPSNLEEMKPALAALMHGCLSGEHNDVWDNIYLPKVTRNNQYFILHRLKSYGRLISAITNFYDKRWQQVNMELKEANRTSVLGASGYALKAVGRNREAAQTMQAGLDILIRIQDWKDAAISAESISELYLKLGEVSRAVDLAHMSLDFADQSEDTFHKWSKRCTFAHALYVSGKTDEARQYFIEAEGILRKENPHYLLYGLAGYHYCKLLLDYDKPVEVIERVKQVLEWMGDDYWLMGKALDWLSIGNAYLLSIEKFSGTEFNLAEEYINKSIEALTTEGNDEYLIQSVLAKSKLYRLKKDFKNAELSLAEAFEIAERGNLILDKINCYIEEINQFVELKKLQKGFEVFINVRELVEKHGYLLKQDEVIRLRSQLGV